MLLIRTVMGFGGIALLIVGLGWTLTGHRDDGLVLVLMGGAGVLIALFERARYGRDEQASAVPAVSAMQRTDEVFTDPTTGERTRVWIDPASGRRDYRPED